MIRVHLTAEDLLRTRFAAAPAPLMELGAALATLQRRDAIFDRWRRELSPRLPRVARLLFQIVPPTAAGPLFLDPFSNGLEDGLDAVLSAPTCRRSFAVSCAASARRGNRSRRGCVR